MNRKTIFESARNGAAVALGVAGVFGVTFAVTSLVAQAEEQAPVAVAPAAPVDSAVDAPAPAPAPDAAPRREPERGRPPRPAFKDMDTNGDGSISQAEFEAFRPAGPPPRFDDDRAPRFEDGPPRRGDWQDDERGAPRGPDREPRRERYHADDDRYAPPPPDDRYGPPPGDGRYGPPPRGRGGRGGEEFSQQGGGDCEHRGGPRPHGGPRDEFGPPPNAPRDGYGSDDYPRPPRRPQY